METKYKKFITDEYRFLLECLDSHKKRLITYVDLGYAEAHSKVIPQEGKPQDLTEKDKKWLEFFTDEIKAMGPFIEMLETKVKLEKAQKKQNQ